MKLFAAVAVGVASPSFDGFEFDHRSIGPPSSLSLSRRPALGSIGGGYHTAIPHRPGRLVMIGGTRCLAWWHAACMGADGMVHGFELAWG